MECAARRPGSAGRPQRGIFLLSAALGRMAHRVAANGRDRDAGAPGLCGSGDGCNGEVVARSGREHALDLRKCPLRGGARCFGGPRAGAGEPVHAVLSGLRSDGRRGRHQISLAQIVLKLTVPGVPDIYQGAELWEQSMVDPDNRRPVDFQHRTNLLEAPPRRPLAQLLRKVRRTRRLLKLRQSNPRLFAEGSYQPLSVDGPGAEAVCAFARLNGDAGLAVAVALRGTEARTREARIALPRHIRGPWVPVLRAGMPFEER